MASYGKNFKISVFGQSHGETIGAVAENFPIGFCPDLDELKRFMERRASRSSLTTPRREGDKVEIVSGLNADGKTCGAPICAIIKNENTRSSDYGEKLDVPRPSHADLSAFLKYGEYYDHRGGGQFSGRLTAPICAIGGLCIQYLRSIGIEIRAHISSIGPVRDLTYEAIREYPNVTGKELPVIGDYLIELYKDMISSAKENSDSLGGTVECAILGFPAGYGGELFDGLEGRIASAIFGIPAVKGVEFGSGFSGSESYGSENNDEIEFSEDGRLITKTNRHGGILGGISSGMPIVFKAAFKPTPTISQDQRSVSFSKGESVTLASKGRHDPCIVLRAVPCVEAVAAITALDILMEKNIVIS